LSSQKTGPKKIWGKFSEEKLALGSKLEKRAEVETW
jgi:hypothetical protein